MQGDSTSSNLDSNNITNTPTSVPGPSLPMLVPSKELKKIPVTDYWC